jgi:hypothetical protein
MLEDGSGLHKNYIQKLKNNEVYWNVYIVYFYDNYEIKNNLKDNK